MEQKAFHRNLTAILSADVAGYSRLMQDDESATVKTLEPGHRITRYIVSGEITKNASEETGGDYRRRRDLSV